MLGVGLLAFMAHKSKKEQEWCEEEVQQEQARKQREMKEEARRNRVREKRANRISFCGRHWKAIMLLIAILVGTSYGYYKYTEFRKLIEVSISSRELIGRDHTSVEKSLQTAGFINIYDDILNDLGIDEEEKEGIVTAVSINGEKDFTSASRFPYDARIEITYHVVKKITVPMSAKSAKRLAYTDLAEQFKAAGFVNITLEAEYDLITGWITKEGAVESISINGETSFDEYASYRPDVPVVITYHTFSKNKDD